MFIFMFVLPFLSFECFGAEKIVDLTWSFNNRTIYWPGVQPFNFTKISGSDRNGYWYAANEFETAEHVGTHLDAPYHFNPNGWDVASIPASRLLVNGILLDFSEETLRNHVPEPESLRKKLTQLEPIPNNTVILFKFGWSKHWPDRTKYLGLDEQGNMNFPGLDKETAEILINHRDKIVGIGLDTPSVDFGSSQTFHTHRLLTGNNFYFLENVKLTEYLPTKGFRLLVAPMKLEGGSGAPVRVLALLPDH